MPESVTPVERRRVPTHRRLWRSSRGLGQQFV